MKGLRAMGSVSYLLVVQILRLLTFGHFSLKGFSGHGGLGVMSLYNISNFLMHPSILMYGCSGMH